MKYDNDLRKMDRDQLIGEVMKLREGIRTHRDATGHNLCWYQPELWLLLPEQIVPEKPENLPPKQEFLERCETFHTECERGPKQSPPVVTISTPGGMEQWSKIMWERLKRLQRQRK